MTNLTRAILPALFITILAVPSPAQTSPTQTHGISIANMDTAVRPGDNFYLYANGGFIAHTKLPADRVSLGVFNALDDLSNKRVAGIIEDAAKSNAAAGPHKDPDQRKIADLYHSYMDEAAIESHGLPALKPHYGDESLRYAIYSGLGFYVIAAALFLIAARSLKKHWVD